MFPHTVTIFNKYEDNNRVKYSKAVLTGVQFVLDEVSSRKNTGDSADDKVTCYIPSSVKSDKVFIDSFAFENDESVDKNVTYTLSKGDLIGFGDISLDELSINEYKNSRGSLYEITGITDYNLGSSLDHKLIVAK
jgi:hypothetical protein